MIDILLCKKTNKKISKNNPKCPVPTGPCKYRMECVIYAFEQLEKMDKQIISTTYENNNEKES